MNIETAKQINLADYLHSLGYSPVKQQGINLWYKSPLRDETEASFKVNTERNQWYDFGLGKGGGTIELAAHLYATDHVSYLLERIAEQTPHVHPVSFSFGKQDSFGPSFQQLEIVPLSSPALLAYLQGRGINLELAKRECSEARYTHNGKRYFAIAFPNGSGGFEVRNPYFKGCIAPKEISHIRQSGKARTACYVFEGFMVIPIVQTERRKKKSEKLVKKNYRKKPSGAARLSANDIMTRHKLKAYQDGYALAMAKYGLKRGIVGSEARHTTTAQYYRDLLSQTEDIQENIGLLLAEKEQAESELAKIKSEARTEQLKNKATDAMTAIASGVGSLFGSGKLKELEQANGKLQGEIDKRDNQIRLLNEHMRMQEERHSTEKHCQQEIHQQELNMKVKKIEELNEIIGKAFKWFPIMREMLQMEKFCKSTGFTQEMIDVLLAKRKPISAAASCTPHSIDSHSK